MPYHLLLGNVWCLKLAIGHWYKIYEGREVSITKQVKVLHTLNQNLMRIVHNHPVQCKTSKP